MVSVFTSAFSGQQPRDVRAAFHHHAPSRGVHLRDGGNAERAGRGQSEYSLHSLGPNRQYV